jgi:hypothetical protein
MLKTTDEMLRELPVKDQLHALEMAYCGGVDRRDAALLRSVFFGDAIKEHGDMYTGNALKFAACGAGHQPSPERGTGRSLNGT